MTFYVGIDIAKFKHDCFVADENGQVVKSSFTFKNDATGFQTLLEVLNPLKKKGLVKIGFESTGHYNYNLKLFLEENNFDYMELHPLLVNKFGYASVICSNGIICCCNGSAHYDVVGADLLRLGGSHDALLVANVTVGKANTGGHGEELFSAGLVNLACLER